MAGFGGVTVSVLGLGCALWACSGDATKTTWSDPTEDPTGAAGGPMSSPAAGAPGTGAAAAGGTGAAGSGGRSSSGGSDEGGSGGASDTPNPGTAGAGGADTDACGECEPTQHCVAGECRDPACEPGIRRCVDGDVYECRADGSGERLKKKCGSYEVCDPGTAACTSKQCEPDSATCDGTKVLTCNDLGSGWLPPVDCAAEGQGCLDGSCAPHLCEPGVKRCDGVQMVKCEPHGLSEATTGYCPGATHCVPPQGDQPDFYCASNGRSCAPNAKLCSANTSFVCNATGTDHLPGEIDCGESVCVDGECKPVVCEGYGDCHDNTVVSCTEKGTSFAVVRECSPSERCVDRHEAPNGAVCAPDACPPNKAACVQNRLGTCAAHGDALAKVTKDCAADSMVCRAGACVVQASDTFGAGDTFRAAADGTLIGNVIDTSSARLLVELEASLKLAQASEVTFVVMEVVANDFFTLKFSASVDAPAGTGWVSSGLIDYELLADRSYLLGVVVSGGPFEANDDQAPWNGAVSFGAARGSLQASPTLANGGDINGKRLFSLRATTELP